MIWPATVVGGDQGDHMPETAPATPDRPRTRPVRLRGDPLGTSPRGRPRWLLAVLAAVLLLATACGGDDGDGDGGPGGAEESGQSGESGDEGTGGTAPEDAEPVYGGHESDLYAGDANWLCHPDIEDDVCARDLDATVVHADGSTEVETHEPAEDPPIDCFYVYPTVSNDDQPNSDLDVAESEEVMTTVNQAARLTSTCRVFAPVYRQGTLGMIGGDVPESANPWETAYADVVDAFRHYIDQDGQGRGFVLVGHSQGTGHLRQLIMEEIDDEPALRDRLVSAILLGWGVGVPEGEVVGGDFENVPACEAPDQVGCAVSYASFRSSSPPPEGSMFGQVSGEGRTAMCVNPASPSGGSTFLQPYFQADVPETSLIGGASAQGFADPESAPEITTPFVTYPDFVEGECVRDGRFSYLELTVHGDPDDPRVDDIGGDLSPEWGMHLVDANVAMGDLVDLVSAQADAYAG